MNDTYSTLLACAAWLLAALTLARARLATTNVFTHWASHGQLHASAMLGRFIADLCGVLVLARCTGDYWRDHRPHHWFKVMVMLNLDPDTLFLQGTVGIEPGVDQRTLRNRVLRAFVSPRVHASMLGTRLQANFGTEQARWRQLFAFAWWGSLLGTATATDMLGAVWLGLLVPLVIGGNVATLAHLLSEHHHGIAAPQGPARHLALSHGRHPLAWLPRRGAPRWHWAVLPLRLLLAVVSRYVFLPGDNCRHVDHHVGTRPAGNLHRWAWPNAADEYTPRLFEDDVLARRNFPGVWAAISAGLKALAAEPRRGPVD